MDIDKSAQPRPRRKAPSAGRCLVYTCGLLGALLILGFVGMMIYGLKTMADQARNPHKDLIHATKPDKYPSRRAVGPLIGKEDRFDVALSIWARVPNSDTPRPEEYAEEGAVDDADLADPANLATAAMVGKPVVEIVREQQEKLLFEGVVFEDVTMRDKGLERKVDLQLPLKRFNDEYIWNSEVRAAISLIPLSPSKLERLEDFSDWRPEIAAPLPRLTPEFMASRRLRTDGGDDTTLWEAIERMAVSYSILEVVDDPSRCPANSTETSASSSSAPSPSDSGHADDDDDLYLWSDSKDRGETESPDPAQESPQFKRAKNGHPFVVTRSHIYLIDETRSFHKMDLDTQHKNLRETSCGQLIRNARPSRMLCNRDYKRNGHWETRLVLHPEEPNGARELAYGPYLGSLHHAAGPKDYIALPIVRGNCTGVTNVTAPQPDVFDFTYTLRFSTLSPGRVQLLDNGPGQTTRPGTNLTDEALIAAHDAWEQIHGVLGNKGEGTKPWTRFVLSVTSDVLLSLPISILSLVYWYTRTTTAGLDIPSCLLFAAGLVGEKLSFLAYLHSQKQDLGVWIPSLLFTAWDLLPALFILKLVFPFEVKRVGWGLDVRRWKWGHRERTSRRISAGIPWPRRAAIFALILLVAWVLRHYHLWLIRPLNPNTTPHTSWTQSNWNQSLLFATCYTPYLFQALFNERSKTFAGQYALTSYLALARTVVDAAYHLPSVVGRMEVRAGVTPFWVVDTGLQVWAVWQATRMPRVEQYAEEGEE